MINVSFISQGQALEGRARADRKGRGPAPGPGLAVPATRGGGRLQPGVSVPPRGLGIGQRRVCPGRAGGVPAGKQQVPTSSGLSVPLEKGFDMWRFGDLTRRWDVQSVEHLLFSELVL